MELTTSGTSHQRVLAGPLGATSAIAEGLAGGRGGGELELGTGGTAGAAGDRAGGPAPAPLASYASESESPVSRHTDCERRYD